MLNPHLMTKIALYGSFGDMCVFVNRYVYAWSWACCGAHTGTTGFALASCEVLWSCASRCGSSRGMSRDGHMLALILVGWSMISYKPSANWAVLYRWSPWLNTDGWGGGGKSGRISPDPEIWFILLLCHATLLIGQPIRRYTKMKTGYMCELPFV